MMSYLAIILSDNSLSRKSLRACRMRMTALPEEEVQEAYLYSNKSVLCTFRMHTLRVTLTQSLTFMPSFLNCISTVEDDHYKPYHRLTRSCAFTWPCRMVSLCVCIENSERLFIKPVRAHRRSDLWMSTSPIFVDGRTLRPTSNFQVERGRSSKYE